MNITANDNKALLATMIYQTVIDLFRNHCRCPLFAVCARRYYIGRSRTVNPRSIVSAYQPTRLFTRAPNSPSHTEYRVDTGTQALHSSQNASPQKAPLLRTRNGKKTRNQKRRQGFISPSPTKKNRKFRGSTKCRDSSGATPSERNCG
jgi:hypothetical protein